jgi:periplasmic protein TonB
MPTLVQPVPGPSLPPHPGVGSPTPLRSGRSTFDNLPRFVAQPEPIYPLMARERGWEGTVVLHIEMLANGTVGEVKVAESSGYPILDNAAQDAVKRWRHLPIKRNGVAVTEWAALPVRFRLN